MDKMAVSVVAGIGFVSSFSIAPSVVAVVVALDIVQICLSLGQAAKGPLEI